MNPRASTSKKDEAPARETSLLFDDSSFFANVSAAASPRPGDRSADTSALNVSALCCDEETSGFDRLSGRTWIYPTNYPVRDYQFNIIKATILQNTLVSLPTGLGKTFIAAVVMYNFYRWYPLGKIVFTAPTRPLVAQQIEACYKVAAIPRAHTVEMTGHMQAATRKTHWREKRVFFATPQVIYNDLMSGICPAERVRCLVFDEAHRARGNYAYGQIVATLTERGHRAYRVLALSATPGSRVEHVVSVVRSLQIAHLELRTENCIDVVRYSHAKRIRTVVVPLGAQLTRIRQQYVEILDSYARRLKQLNILGGNIGNLSKGRVVMLYKEFQAKERGARHPQHNNIMKDFTLLISLCHGLELLSRHGARVFLNFFDEHAEKTWIQADDRLTALLERLRDDLGVNPLALDRSTMPDGSVAEVPGDVTFGHPKFEELRRIVVEHFKETEGKGHDTRAIVFCEYRESVNLVHCLLLQCRPLVKPMMFVGQGASGKDGKAAVSQKAQLRVMRSFREGACNVLVATCVAEEGLDVGSVDLIVCFDVSTRSPVRLVQRCGRTGRERGGRVHILVTEGREHQTLQECMRQRDNLNQRVLNSADVRAALYALNPRMLPPDLTPACQKMFITAKPVEADDKGSKKKGQKDLRSMLGARAPPACASTSADGAGAPIAREEFEEAFPEGLPQLAYFQDAREVWTCRADEFKSSVSDSKGAKLDLSEWLEWQRRLQTTVRVGHSTDAETLCEVLQYADGKRFDVPQSSQAPQINTQMMNSQALQMPSPELKKKMAPSKKKPKLNELPRKGGDIRALFSTTKKSTKEYTKLVNELGVDNFGSLPTSVIDLMVDLCVQDETAETKCQTCENIFDCGLLETLQIGSRKISDPTPSILKNLNLPDIQLLDNIDVKSIENAFCQDPIKRKSFESEICLDDSVTNENLFPKEVKNQSSTIENPTSNFDLEFDFDGSDVEESKSNNEHNTSKTNFDIGNIEDIFVDSSSQSIEDQFEKEKSKDDKKEALEFFGLDSIDDIFADSNDDDVHIDDKYAPEYSKNVSSQEEKAKDQEIIISTKQTIEVNRPASPSLLAGTRIVNDTIVSSPILCSQRNRLSLNRTNSAKCSTPLSSETSQKILSMKPKSLFGEALMKNNNVIDLDENTMDWSNIQGTSTEKVSREKLTRKSYNNIDKDTTGSKSLFTITQLIEMINKPFNDSGTKLTEKNNLLNLPTGHKAATISNCLDPRLTETNNNRSSSPILFTQADVQRALDSSQAARNKANKANTTTCSTQNRSQSPIILTQIEREKNRNSSQCISKSQNKFDLTRESLVILDSDSDDTVSYDITPEKHNKSSSFNKETLCENAKSAKRKFNNSTEDPMLCSPYFSKRPKLDNYTNKPLSLKEKLQSIFKTDSKNPKPPDNTHIGYMITSPVKLDSQKENLVPSQSVCDTEYSNMKQNNYIDIQDDGFELEDDWFTPCKVIPTSPVLSQRPAIEKLQIFRRENNSADKHKQRIESIGKHYNSMKLSYKQKQNGKLSDSDDDFIVKENNNKNKCRNQDSPIVNYKVRKKKTKASEFLDLEAELSECEVDSGDEMSGDSELDGSLAEFICDEQQPEAVDMQALYLRSVKSPVKGKFRIPQLPQHFTDVFSQPDHRDDDTYEMDSFCVEAGVGLTQAHDVSELELAERRYMQRKRARRRGRKEESERPGGSGRPSGVDSPVARPNKVVKRTISSSDSE